MLCVCKWILASSCNSRIGLYCSDVAGAFDRVNKARLIGKLRGSSLHPKLVSIFENWLRDRLAHIVISGSKSKSILMRNMVYQGTVFGLMLWNIFFKDASDAIRTAGFEDISYADDLNAYKIHPGHLSQTFLQQDMNVVQHNLHSWGEANGVRFDASKESFHVLSRTQDSGSSFK